MTWSVWMTPMQRVRNQVKAMHSLYSSFFLFFLSYLVAWLWLHIYLSSVWLTIDLTLSRWPGSEVGLIFLHLYVFKCFLFISSFILCFKQLFSRLVGDISARWRSRKGDGAPAGAILRSKREPGQWRQICICIILDALASLDLNLPISDLLILFQMR